MDFSEYPITKNFDEKVQFLALYNNGTTRLETIHNKTGTSLRTLRDWREKTEAGVNILEIKPGRGRKPKYSEIIEDIKEEVIKHPYQASLRRTGSQFNIDKNALQKTLVENQFAYRRVKVSKKLKEEDKKERKKFCKNLLKNPEQIYEGVFADESGIWLSDAHKQKIWTQEEEPRYTPPKEDIKLNFWGAISKRGTTSLYIFKENFDQKVYKDILSKHQGELNDMFPKGYFYFHDRHPSHTAIDLNIWANENNMHLNLFPVSSSDLNPIENLWAWLKGEVARDCPRNEKELRASLRRHWNGIDKKFLNPYIESIFNRCDLCIKNSGGYISY